MSKILHDFIIITVRSHNILHIDDSNNIVLITNVTIETQFNNIYGYSNNMSALAPDFIQMLRRIRHPESKSFSICNEYTPYYSDLLSIENIERYIKYAHIIGDCNESIKDIPKHIENNKFVPIKNLAYYIHIYNVLEEEINRCYFEKVLIYLAKRKGMVVEYTNNWNKKDKTIREKIKKVKIENQEKIIKEISSSEVIDDKEYETVTNKMSREEKLTSEDQNNHKLKTLLNRFKYDTKRYQKLKKKEKVELVKFMMDDDNHFKFVNNNMINGNNEERIEQIKKADAQRKSTVDAHEYQQYHRPHYLIDKMIKLLGFSSIKDDTKLTVEVIHENITKNQSELLNLVNEMHYANNEKKITKVEIKTVGTIIRNFYGYVFKYTSIWKNKSVCNAYQLNSSIKWGCEYHPFLMHNNKDFNNYAF